MLIQRSIPRATDYHVELTIDPSIHGATVTRIHASLYRLDFKANDLYEIRIKRASVSG